MTESRAVFPFRDLAEASREVFHCLRGKLGFDLWLVTRVSGDDWIILAADDRSYGVAEGQVLRWSDSFCSRMVNGEPRIAPRSDDVRAYAAAPIGRQLPIAAYVGVPLHRLDGSLFGTLCAIDPNEQPDSIVDDLPVVEAMARIIATMLEQELMLASRLREIERVQALAFGDVLTGLVNRTYWESIIASEEDRCRRYGHALGIGIIDLDSLKSVNDAGGHSAGDALLANAAAIIRNTVRASDIVARIGGDEFAVLFPESNEDALRDAASRIVSALDAAGIEASTGWSLRDPRYDVSHAIRAADAQMYEQKRARRLALTP
jgi:diguanylate cyclase